MNEHMIRTNGTYRQLDPATEKRARRTLRLMTAEELLRKHARPPEAPDFRTCASVSECAWVGMGGDVEEFRALMSDEESESIEALGQLAASFDQPNMAHHDERRKAEIAARQRDVAASTARDAAAARALDDRARVIGDQIDAEDRATMRRLGLPDDLFDLRDCRTESEMAAVVGRRAKATT